MDALQQAIDFAKDAKADDFKEVINNILADKVRNRLELEKMQYAAKIFGDSEEEGNEVQDDSNFTTSAEENTDEEV